MKTSRREGGEEREGGREEIRVYTYTYEVGSARDGGVIIDGKRPGSEVDKIHGGGLSHRRHNGSRGARGGFGAADAFGGCRRLANGR